MIFLGDLACPQEKIDSFISCVNGLKCFNDEIVVVNFEGNIVDQESERNDQSLYNVSKIVKAFSQTKKVIVSLANNHMYDYPDKILETERILNAARIGTFGVIHNGKIVPYEFTDDNGETYAFFGHCWRLYTQTNPNIINSVSIVDVPYIEFISIVAKYVKKNRNVKTFCFMHWNYDLEIVPFPMHRDIAKRLIDAGVSGVIGSHPHVVQGFEIYKNAPIAYSLGNFYLPSGLYFHGALKYPEESRITLGVKINNHDVKRLWFKTDTEPLPVDLLEDSQSKKIDDEMTSISSYGNKEYIDYFRWRRRKRLLVPIYVKPDGLLYRIQEAWAIFRVKLIKIMKG